MIRYVSYTVESAVVTLSSRLFTAPESELTVSLFSHLQPTTITPGEGEGVPGEVRPDSTSFPSPAAHPRARLATNQSEIGN